MPPMHLAIVYAVTLVWGFNFVAVATVLESLPPLLFTLIRFLIVLLGVLPWIRLPARDQWWRLVAICLLGGTLHFVFLFFAMRWSSDISSVAILLQTFVPMTAILGVVILGERIGWRTGLAITVAFAGVLVVSFDPVVFEQLDSAVTVMGAALCMALATVLMRGLKGISPLAYQGWTALLSLPVLLPAVLVFEPGQWRLLSDLPLLGWIGVLYSALAASIVGHGLMFWLVQRHPVSTVTPHLLLAPIFGVVFGVLVWGDQLGPRLVLGGALVLGGVLAVAVRAGRRSIQPDSVDAKPLKTPA